MNEAQRIVNSLFEKVGIEMNSGNVYYLFNSDSDLEFETTSDYVSWKERETNPINYKIYNDEVGSVYSSVNELVHRIECEGGGEGEGEYCYGVIKIGDVYLKAEWSYYSYNGYEIDYIINTLQVVTTQTKTITVYE